MRRRRRAVLASGIAAAIVAGSGAAASAAVAATAPAAVKPPCCRVLLRSAAAGWGDNGVGQLGNGGTNVVIRPAEAPGLDSGITQIAAGNEFALARHADGTVWAWGADDHGELGNGTTTGVLGATPAPVQVTGLSGVTQISAGYSHGLAIQQVPLFSLP
jgi:Regulator of chromosome condensation (RCC1) repeat